jgi:hypothetical protein
MAFVDFAERADMLVTLRARYIVMSEKLRNGERLMAEAERDGARLDTDCERYGIAVEELDPLFPGKARRAKRK